MRCHGLRRRRGGSWVLPDEMCLSPRRVGQFLEKATSFDVQKNPCASGLLLQCVVWQGHHQQSQRESRIRVRACVSVWNS